MDPKPLAADLPQSPVHRLPTSPVLVPVPRSAPPSVRRPVSESPDAILNPPPTDIEPPARSAPATPQSETSAMSASLSAAAPAASADGLASAETMNAAAGSVTNLVRALTSDRSSQVYSGGPTIADLVREEMRPMLKAWLDANLPPLVERLVRAEIERVISRASV
jgi:cell pole-organizing protein PopZ